MYKSTNEKAKEMRKTLKEKFNFSNRDVSIKSDIYSFNIRIKTSRAAKKFKEIENICKSHEHVYRDEYTGEILSGGNTFVFVEIDESAYSEYFDLAKELMSVLEESNYAEYHKGNEILKIFKLDKFTVTINNIHYNLGDYTYLTIAKHIAKMGE